MMKTPQLSGQLAPVLNHPHSKKVFLNVQREPPLFQFVPIFVHIPYACLFPQDPMKSRVQSFFQQCCSGVLQG